MSALTGRGGAIAVGALSALLTAVAARRPWVRGTVEDAMIGGSVQEATGQEAVTGFVALGLVVLAGAVAAAATRRMGRRVASVILLLTAVGMAALVLRVLLDPAQVLGTLAAASTGRTGTLAADAAATPWAFAALLPAVGAFVAAALAWRGATRWPLPSAAYDRPGAERPGRRGERVSTDWERLSSGEDPTTDRGGP
jgi:uncharacterized membrane protein (TIGR02234 family)